VTTVPLSAETSAVVDRLEAADIVVAATACTTSDAVILAANAVEAAGGGLSRGLRIVLVHPDTASVGDVRAARPANGPLQLAPCRLPAVGRLPFTPVDERELFAPLAAITAKTGAGACAIVGAVADGIKPASVSTLLAPVLAHGCDLVLPSYHRHRFDGLINSGIVHPFSRALYGRRVDGQLGIDFGFSPRFLAALVQRHPRENDQGRAIWLLSEAVARGMQVAQGHLDNFLPPLEQATDVSTALAQVLGSLFDDTERHAATWQRTRGTLAVPVFGDPGSGPDEPRHIEVRSMIDSFQIGFRNLREVWGHLLPPATLVELNRLAALPADRFRVPDALWARTVFDFALGHRLRTIGREHLLRAMTPLYLAWVASFVLEVDGLDRDAASERLERLCVAYEGAKPYMLARWRWPDRFNP
jgi:hypothetical protein